MSRAGYSPICANFFGNPADKLKLIGLTGTNGKTTTTFLIKQILENVGKKVGLIGTVQNMVGDEIYPAKYTTPDPYELQKLFSLMVKAGCEYCVMEVSSQALAQGRVNGLRFAQILHKTILIIIKLGKTILLQKEYFLKIAILQLPMPMMNTA